MRGGRHPSKRETSLAPVTAFDDKAEIPHEHLDPDALTVIHRLRSFGHQAYLVGGCVRDLLLGLHPKDFDVATSAHPGEIRAIFRNCRLIGRRFRLAHVYFRGGNIVETATFRANPNGKDQGVDLLITRDNVFGTAEEDAKRRDFTINGLFYDVVLGKVLDYVGGKKDLEDRILRTIGDPDVRIQEDPVRLLRAVRFAAKLDFTIEPKTWDALVRYKGELARCAPARVLEEIFRLLRSGNSKECLELLLRLDALQILLPPLAGYLQGLPEVERDGFFTFLGLLDEVVRRGRLPDDSILLASLLAHLAMNEGREATPAMEEADEEEAQASAPAEEDASEGQEQADEGESEPPLIPWAVSASAATVEELLRELSRSARLPRRISERANTLLRTMRVLSGARRRRGSPMRLVRQAHFVDSLFLYWLWVKATGTGEETLDTWLKRAEQANLDLPWLEEVEAREEETTEEEPPEEAPSARAEEEPTPSKARGGRRRRRGARSKEEAAGGEESLPPKGERGPPPGPANFLPF